jgi:hypothetical protein
MSKSTKRSIRAMNLREKALPCLEKLFRQVRELTQELGFSDKNRQQIVAMSLHGAVIEIVDGLIATLRRSNGTAAWILARSLLEAFVDLINVVNESNYVDFMHASFLEQQRKRIEIAQKRGAANPYLQGITGSAKTPRHGQRIAELQGLKKRGVVPLKVIDRFERAGQLELYDGPYSIMSQYTHNNLAALEQQHLKMQPTGVTVTYFREPTDEEVGMLLDAAGKVLVGSLEVVRSILQNGSSRGVDGIMKELHKLQGILGESA